MSWFSAAYLVIGVIVAIAAGKIRWWEALAARGLGMG